MVVWVDAPTADPSVPNDIASSIQTVGGLDNVAHYHPLGVQKSAHWRAGSVSQVPRSQGIRHTRYGPPITYNRYSTQGRMGPDKPLRSLNWMV